MGTLIVVAGMLASGFCGFFVFLVALFRAPRKGYQAGIIVVLIFVGISVGTLFLATSANFHAVLGPLIVLLPPAFLLLMLPRRKPRRIFSVQRVGFPYAAIGQAIFLIGCVATAILSPLAWWTGGPWWLALVILAVGPTLAFRLKTVFTDYFGQPVRAVASFADLLAPGHRPPVIFMRAFDRDGGAFMTSNDDAKYRPYSRTVVRAKGVAVAFSSLDNYLKSTVERRIGPFLALGNPRDYFTPAGALRAYFKDETWMEEFRELAQRAACFLVEAGESSNLRWELQYLRQAKLHDRLVVVAGHPTNANSSVWVELAARMAGNPKVSWQAFAATLKEIGYEVPAGAPEFGTVIGFDSEARAHVLTSDADLPDEFVEPIEAWLDSQELGRCVEVACTKCARLVFKRSDMTPATYLCPTCRVGSPIIHAAFQIVRWTGALLAFPAFIGVLIIPNFDGWPRWIIYPWAALVLIGGIVLWYLTSTVVRRLENTLARR
jgi:hypothetical protein